MTVRTRILATVAVMLSAGFVTGTAHAQNGVYAFHSDPKGTCPGLDWHVTRAGPDLAGFIAWDNGKSIARVKGVVTSSDFTLDTMEVGGTRTAKITGTIVGGNTMVAKIAGVPACEGKSITVPWYQAAMGGGG